MYADPAVSDKAKSANLWVNFAQESIEPYKNEKPKCDLYDEGGQYMVRERGKLLPKERESNSNLYLLPNKTGRIPLDVLRTLYLFPSSADL